MTAFNRTPSNPLAVALALLALGTPPAAEDRVFRAGASAVDISPPTLPVRRNGGFLEATADRVVEPLFARALVLNDGTERVAVVVVDSCMLSRELCDEVKALAGRDEGIARDRILISATHTHSAPSAMDYCLGSRADPEYTRWLPPRIASAITDAARRETPAEIGFTVAQAPEHTNCRRWILRRDRVGLDPFGERTVRAMMHPGYQNPDYVGPAGPIDPGLSLISVRRVDGRPLALLGNYSMHYFGVGGGLSPDFCGVFARRVAARVAPDDESFVGILSQGTSGDLHWMDYSRPRRSVAIDGYTEGLVDIALEAYRTIRHVPWVPLRMAERRLSIERRRPDAARLEWARKTLPDRTRRPRNRPEVYAEQAFYIDENPSAEVVLQAVRIGELGITAIPCEVYGITGLELKTRSPLQPTFTIELANGGAGYIPPPAQHAFGGYTTWPARTAGLAVEAEPRIVDTLLDLLETVSEESRRPPPAVHGSYAATVLADRPVAYWRLEEFRGPRAIDASGNDRHATIGELVAFHLPGPESSAFSADRTNRCVHLAGGAVEASELPVGPAYSIELWFWNGLHGDGRDVLGTLLRVATDELRIVGAPDADSGRLAIGELRDGLHGETGVVARTWNHVVLTRSGDVVNVYLNGRLEVEGTLARGESAREVDLAIGRGGDSAPVLEGKVDEVSVFDRALSPNDVARHHAAAGIAAPSPPPPAAGFATKPSSPADIERVAAAIREAGPLAYWPLVAPAGARDASGNGRDGTFEDGARARSPGAAEANFTGGRLRASLEGLGDRYSVELWFSNELSNTARPVTGYFFSRGRDGASGAPGEHLGIGGTHTATATGRLIVFNGNRRDQLLVGKTIIRPRTWNHVVLVRDGARVTVFLNGRTEPEASGELDRTYPGDDRATIFIGGRNDGFANFRGRIDQVAVYDRALTPAEAMAHFRAAGLQPSEETAATKPQPPRPLTPPRSPDDTVRATRVRDGFRLELVAAEPLVIDPVAIDWDAAGRLWVAEMADYPLGIDGAGAPGGRVRILEDADADGRYDRSTLFADGLDFPTGVLAWRRGVLVTAAPEILYLSDEDGDGRAERREALFSGFLPGNQQLRVNGLRWGIDNWIYCASGAHHAGYGADRRVRSLKTSAEIALGSRDLRIRPDEGLLEPQSGPSQFGRVRDDWGNWFGVQNSQPLWHYVLADQYSRRNRHVAAPDARQLVRGVSPALYPAKTPQKRYHSFEDATRFTSACGPCVYRDDVLFGPSEETHAFTCDPFHGLVQHSVLTRSGVSFDAKVDTPEGGHDFIASTDRWCRPVMVRTGPDGALWIVDMYRYMIEHPEWLPPVGKEELRPFYRSGDDRGRIYRVVPSSVSPDAPVLRSPILARDTSAALVDRLTSSNGTVRDLAQRLLVERRDPAVVDKLERMALVDRRPLARLHALGTLDGMGALTPRIVRALLDDSETRVVRHALRLAEPLGESEEIVAAAVRHVASPDAALRLQLALTLGEWRGAVAGRALGELAVRDHASSWARAAVLSSAVDHQEAIARRVAADAGGALRELASPLLSLALATKRTAVVGQLLAPVVTAGADGTAPDELGEWQFVALARFLDALAAAGTSLERLARDDSRLDPLVARTRRVLEIAAGLVVADSRPESVRAAAASLLGRSPANVRRDRELLTGLLATTVPGPVQSAAIVRLRDLGGQPGALLSAWTSYMPDVRSAVAQAMLSRTTWTGALLDAIEDARIPASTIAPTERQRLVSHRDPAIASRARRLLAAGISSDRGDALAAFRPAIRLNGFAARGREVFAARCAACHSLEDVGTVIGPDLRALTDRSGEALLTSILDPNASVEPRYVAYTAILRSGEVVHGLIAGETGNSLVLQLADGSQRSVLRSAIASLQSSGLSFMPEGLEAEMSLRDAADLLAFLQRL